MEMHFYIVIKALKVLNAHYVTLINISNVTKDNEWILVNN